eukprot:scaffold39959_cov64-Attheya_sp.AAC.5
MAEKACRLRKQRRFAIIYFKLIFLKMTFRENGLDDVTGDYEEKKNSAICPPKHHTHTSENTYVIAMGPKNVSHEVVWRRLQQDLKHLSGSFTGERPSFYHSRILQNDVHATTLVLMQYPHVRNACQTVYMECLTRNACCAWIGI